ncbi:SigE family RNA polymerase sigma factor [Actinomadura bangladeshensis]|uniref:SigE family RNA polymerase sigma factor n=1 Tax=Actinomadura bangladeshensis TaxID=453573 RepID=A0A6L9QCB0_9ACTN|nr:SigE family RNA polymerase sigma factor [Actinomadura bangladeshensis]NEA23081.1 SigE family RNA polymerase sigma factor [Actinomadura bangladeshensis]
MDDAEERHFREFVETRSAALMRLAYLLAGGDQHAAEDLLQAALAKAAKHWGGIDDPEPYVRRTLYRQQVSTWRRTRRRRETRVAAPPEEAARDAMSAVDLKLTVRTALARLTSRQRAVLVLRFFEDLPEAEVARILGCGVGTVRSTTHRSLARLRELAPELNDRKPEEARQ